MRNLILLSLILNISLVFCQDPIPKFGEVLVTDFNQDYTIIDSTAQAMILYEIGNVYFDLRGNATSIETEVKTRIHIRNAAALDAANFNINFTQVFGYDNENISKIKGATYNISSGKVQITELSKDDIFDEVSYTTKEYINKTKKVKFPNVKEGSIIELTYLRSTPMSLRSNLSSWSFQSKYPCKWSQYNASIPTYYYYQVLTGGFLEFALSSRERSSKAVGTATVVNEEYKLAVANAPAFDNEKFVPCPRDYISRVEFELSSVDFPGGTKRNYNESWDALDATVRKSEKWNDVFANNNWMDPITKLFVNIQEPKEKLKAIFNYMRKNYKWNGEERLWLSHPIKNVTKTIEGSGSELNIFAIALCKASGLNAEPMIISTKNNGRIITQYPLLDRFNYTMGLVMMEKDTFVLDVTDTLLTLGNLRPNLYGDIGRVIPKEGRCFFYNYSPKMSDTKLVTIAHTIDLESAKLSSVVKKTYNGFAAYNYRSAALSKSPKELEENAKKHLGTMQMINFKVQNLENIALSPTLEYALEREEDTDSDFLYIEPFLSEGISDNPFTEKERRYPIDFEKKISSGYNIEIIIPEGYAVEQIPSNVNLVLPDKSGIFSYTAEIKDRKIKITSRIAINNTLYAADTFIFFKQFYVEVIKKMGAQVVLKKVKK